MQHDADPRTLNDMLQQYSLEEQVVSLAAAILASDDTEDPVIAAAGFIRMTLILAKYLSMQERQWLAIKALEIAAELDVKLN